MVWKKVAHGSGAARQEGKTEMMRRKGYGNQAVVKQVEGGGVTLVKGTPQQEAIWTELVKGKKHIIVKALAGTGKTFTVIQGLHRLAGAGLRNVAFIAFNRSIANELQQKVPHWAKASTCHSLMYRALMGSFGRLEVNEDRTLRFLEDAVGGEDEMRRLRRENPATVSNVKKLVGLVKNTLAGYDCENQEWVGVTDDELDQLAINYSLELNGSAEMIYQLVKTIVEWSLDIERSMREIDYDDQLWLPIVHNVQLPVHDLLCVDECQDLNRVQQEAILRMGSRIMLVGDENQAIYGFRGADIESMGRMEASLGESKKGVKVLPLTYTRRCPKSHVKLAAEIVKDFKALPEAPEGEVQTLELEKAITQMGEGDLAICRTNAPVVSAAFRLLKAGVRANIQGRDLGQGLLALVKKLNRGQLEGSVDTLLERLEDYRAKEIARIYKKKFPSEAQAQALQDKCDCVSALCNGAATIEEVAQRVEKLFLDIGAGGERNFVLLSSVHRAKGLEAERVFILEPEKMPHPMAKSAGEKQQEWNIRYVALTRSKNVLVFVPGPKKQART
jgi:DNA helicase-2/ATP-dependent DNA helicase PcrA